MCKVQDYVQSIVNELIDTQSEFATLKEDGVKVKVFFDREGNKHCYASPAVYLNLFGIPTNFVMGIAIPNYFKMIIRESSKTMRRMLLNVMYHELVHVNQFYSGDAIFDNQKNFIYKGVKYSTDEIIQKYIVGGKYDSFEWEVEAHTKANKAFPAPSNFMLFLSSQKALFLYEHNRIKNGTKFEINVELDSIVGFMYDGIDDPSLYIENLRKLVTGKTGETV